MRHAGRNTPYWSDAASSAIAAVGASCRGPRRRRTPAPCGRTPARAHTRCRGSGSLRSPPRRRCRTPARIRRAPPRSSQSPSPPRSPRHSAADRSSGPPSRRRAPTAGPPPPSAPAGCASARRRSRRRSRSPSRRANRSQVSAGRFSISHSEAATDRIGITGTHGVRNARCRSGRVRRRMMTPRATTTKAKSVPMFTSSASSLEAGEAGDDRDDHAEQDASAGTGCANFGWVTEKNARQQPVTAHREEHPGLARAAGSCTPW